MLTIVSVVLLIVSVVMACILWLEELRGEKTSDFKNTIIGIMFIVGFFGLIFCFICAVVIEEEYKAKYDHEYKIYALKDNINSGFEGTGSIRSFIIKSQDKYHYMYKYNNGLKMGYILTENGYIQEKDTEEPRIEVYVLELKGILRYIKLSEKKHEYKITVPEGTITTEYNIDLK